MIMGVIVKQKIKGKGKPWWVFINHNGMRKAKMIGDKPAAEDVASRIRRKLKLGEFRIEDEKRLPLFRDYTKKWLEGYAKTACKYSTWKSYKINVDLHLNPILGNKHLNEITRTNVKDLIYQKLNQGLTPSTVRNIKAALSGIMTYAFEDGLISVNPASRTGKLIKKKDRKEDINPFTKEEVTLFLDACLKYFPRFYPLFLCAVRTGMRLGEILALKWEDIDFNGRFIEVKRSYVAGQITTPKSGKSRRVDMSLQLTGTLERLKESRDEEALRRRWDSMPEWVFCNGNGRLIDHNNLRKQVFYKCLEIGGLRRVRIHDLRHTYASLLIAQGESLAYIKDQLGHHSIQITVDTYGHLIPGANKSAVDKLDDSREGMDGDTDATGRNLYATKGGYEIQPIH